MNGPLPAILRPLAAPASWVYGRGVAARNARFDRGEGVARIDRPVISIGNITTGGTGKTPMVMWTARVLKEAGIAPAIAMRGYKARPGEIGDEEAEYGRSLPDVPVVANPDRVGALRRFLPGHPEAACVILDDGFQHRRLHRDLDVVLIDATHDLSRDRLLPAGRLREPLANLKRADAVIVTRANGTDAELSRVIERFHGHPPLAWTSHRWASLFAHGSSDAPSEQTARWLGGKRVVTMCGVGNPRSVIRQAESFGAVIAANVPARDHERFSGSKLDAARRLCVESQCDAMLMTMKDWVRLGPDDVKGWPVPIVVPRVEIEVFEGETELRRRILAAAGKPTAEASVR